MQGATAAVERVFREEYGRLIASLVGRFGDIDIAQDAAGEALVAALEKWPESGVPPNPGGWLTTTAGNPTGWGPRTMGEPPHPWTASPPSQGRQVSSFGRRP